MTDYAAPLVTDNKPQRGYPGQRSRVPTVFSKCTEANSSAMDCTSTYASQARPMGAHCQATPRSWFTSARPLMCVSTPGNHKSRYLSVSHFFPCSPLSAPKRAGATIAVGGVLWERMFFFAKYCAKLPCAATSVRLRSACFSLVSDLSRLVSSRASRRTGAYWERPVRGIGELTRGGNAAADASVSCSCE